MMARTRRRKPVTLPVLLGYDGKFELGFRVVDDPYDAGRKLTVAANVKASGLVWLKSRGLLDDAQFTAGMRFQSLCEQAEIGGARGVDHSRPVVDGGGIAASGCGDATANSIRELADIRRAIGDPAQRILVALIGEGMTIAAYATRLNGGHPSRLMADNVAAMLRAALDGLIVFWGVGCRK